MINWTALLPLVVPVKLKEAKKEKKKYHLE